MARVVISSLSATSPVGGTIEQTYAAIRANAGAFTENQIYQCEPLDSEWDEKLPCFSASIPFLPSYIENSERFVQIAIPALTELLNKSKMKRDILSRTGIFIGLPRLDDATCKLNLNLSWLRTICYRMGLNSINEMDISQDGKIGFFRLVQNAIHLLESRKLEYCIVGGVDSYLLSSRLELLDGEWRLKSIRNVDGFIPGEAGSMVLLESEDTAIKRGVKPLAIVGKELGIGTEHEIYPSGKNSSGEGLSQSIRSALASEAITSPIDTVYSSLNGESYFAYEWGLIPARLGHLFSDKCSLFHPADCYGDIGSATGAMLTSLAVSHFQKEPSVRNALVFASDIEANRGALYLQKYTSLN